MIFGEFYHRNLNNLLPYQQHHGCCKLDLSALHCRQIMNMIVVVVAAVVVVVVVVIYRQMN